ncbi:glycosyltransferase family 2 protein [Planktotalea sp.]|uniref:glycosyltransferase family 2 protein n=1 Tax=Planktotalea sp. TaxID=2029877 RepID=UPI003297A6A9
MTQASQEKTALVACMRNEGLFILEWVAYHKVIGFDQIVICSNDCTDGSDILLDALSDAGEIIHLPHVVGADDTPQDSGIRATFLHLAQTDIEWLAHIDADEFVNIGIGAGKVTDLLVSAGMGDVIALPWWAFGDNGHKAWPGGVLEHFTQAEESPVPGRAKFKSMFRFRKFGHANDHMPSLAYDEHPDVRSAEGAKLSDEGVHAKKRAKYRPIDLALCPEVACINHYAVPSRDVFLMKNDRGDGQGKQTDKYRIGSRWHQIANQNAKPNHSIQRHLDATQQEMTRLRENTQIAHAETNCLSWFHARCRELLSDTQIASWTKRKVSS